MAKLFANRAAGFASISTGNRGRKPAFRLFLPYKEMRAMRMATHFKKTDATAAAITVIDKLIATADNLLRVKSLQQNKTEIALMEVRAQRDDAIRERDQAKAERDAVKQELLERDINGLTGLLTRDAGNKIIPLFVDTVARKNEDVCVFLIDIDHFKKFNDDHGHTTGDAVLREVAQTIKKSVRKNDLTIRYGGEEILVVGAIKKKGNRSAMAVMAEKIRIAVQSITSHIVTISIGVCAFDPQQNPQPFKETVDRADIALYVAKKDGRNCVRFMDDDDAVKPLLPRKPRAKAAQLGNG